MRRSKVPERYIGNLCCKQKNPTESLRICKIMRKFVGGKINIYIHICKPMSEFNYLFNTFIAVR